MAAPSVQAKEPFAHVAYDQAPCPWCGFPPTVEPLSGGWPRKRMVHCVTRTCPVRPAVLAPDLEQAFARWDRRMSESDLPAAGLRTIDDVTPEDLETGARAMFELMFPNGCWETCGRNGGATHRQYLERTKVCLASILQRRRRGLT